MTNLTIDLFLKADQCIQLVMIKPFSELNTRALLITAMRNLIIICVHFILVHLQLSEKYGIKRTMNNKSTKDNFSAGNFDFHIAKHNLQS